jgi:shikimate 5-dehydrogenase
MLAHEAGGAAVIGAGGNTAAITTAARDATSNRFVIAFFQIPNS